MKNIIILFVFVMSFSFAILPAFADVAETLTAISPEKTKILNEKLNVLKNTLVEMQKQAAAKAASEAPAPIVIEISTGKEIKPLSAQEIEALGKTLQVLQLTLIDLQSRLKISENSVDKTAVVSSLKKITENLAVVSQTIGTRLPQTLAAFNKTKTAPRISAATVEKEISEETAVVKSDDSSEIFTAETAASPTSNKSATLVSTVKNIPGSLSYFLWQ